MLHEALRLTRVFHDLSQTQLAHDLSISKSYLSEIESGKKAVSLEILEKYSQRFDIPASSLLLFSEKLESGRLSDKIKTFAANKVLKMLNWIAVKDELNDFKKKAPS